MADPKETTTKTVGEWSYVIAHAPATTSLQAAARLTNAIGPAIEGFAVGRGAGRSLGAVSFVMQSPQLGAHLAFLCDSFVPYTQVVKGAKSQTLKDVFDTHFAGRVGALMQWLEAVIEFELADFLEEVRNKLKALEVAGESKSNSDAQPAPETTG